MKTRQCDRCKEPMGYNENPTLFAYPQYGKDTYYVDLCKACHRVFLRWLVGEPVIQEQPIVVVLPWWRRWFGV